MKKLSFILSFLLFICLLIGCRKDPEIPPTIVNGQVLEKGTNKPLENVEVVLMEGTYNGFGSGTYSFYPVDTFLTDKNGKYSYEHKIPFNKKAYELWYFKQDYFDISNIEDNTKVTYVEDNKTVNTTVKMFPFAWLTVRVINDKPFDVDDEGAVGGEWSTGQYLRFQGKNINSTFTKKIRGGQKTELYWWVYKNNTAKFYSDSIYVVPRDTTHYTLKY
jgi:hypothetical protein